MSEVERLCDRVGIVHKGQLRASGTLDELIQRTGKRYLEEIFVSLVDDEESKEKQPQGYDSSRGSLQ